MDAGAGIALAAGANNLQILNLVAVLKRNVIHLTITTHVHFHALRQGVDHGDPYAVQAAGELIVLVRELAARVQPTEDQFNRRNTLFRVNVHGHAATVVDNFQRLIGM
ncbi:hypothetical protein SDC9_189431 [bioreactor metagenome]|uniref:Uncharacterized protein n=1 Tax=bioreactor metagenome TaxID=1076179 RepID=A0A645HTH9_9ZZZZ